MIPHGSPGLVTSRGGPGQVGTRSAQPLEPPPQAGEDPGEGLRLARRQRYRQAYLECEQLRWMLCVQRESMGLMDHSWVNRVFPLPPAPLTA